MVSWLTTSSLLCDWCARDRDHLASTWLQALAALRETRERDASSTTPRDTTAWMSRSSHLTGRVKVHHVRFSAGAGRFGWGAPPRVVDARFRPMSTSIDVVINGQPRAVNAGTTITVL